MRKTIDFVARARAGIAIIAVASLAMAVSMRCATTSVQERSPLELENQKFLDSKDREGELFRVLFTSEKYVVKQLGNTETIVRSPDPGGDTYICNELKKHDKFAEVKESVISVWLYPDSGNLMKIRSKQPTFLFEIDKILLEDLQRWSFKFPKKYVVPTRFDIKYRIVLRKTLSDQEIMKDLREKLLEKGE